MWRFPAVSMLIDDGLRMIGHATGPAMVLQSGLGQRPGELGRPASLVLIAPQQEQFWTSFLGGGLIAVSGRRRRDSGPRDHGGGSSGVGRMCAWFGVSSQDSQWAFPR